MQVWLIEPRDPLLARDGRPFGPNPGARAGTLPFPFPSTVAGAVRTLAGSDEDGLFDTARIGEVLGYQIAGPLLVEVAGKQALRFLAPAPADALLLPLRGEKPGAGEPKNARRQWLAPLAVAGVAQCGWPDGIQLAPVGQRNPQADKPIDKPPRFWYWEALLAWLEKAGDDMVMLADLGHSGPTEETRMHVRIDSARQSAAEGMLFQTKGLEFTHGSLAGGATRLALACATDAPLRSGVAAMAGERRLVRWQPAGEAFPACPDSLRTAVVRDRHCRLMLLTPAHFAAGSLPEWLSEAVPGVAVHIVGAAMGRPQVVSGWNLAEGGAKATRKLAPAGAVYYLALEGSPEAIGEFVDAMWMQCVSDDAQSRNDGFGLAVCGTWNGQLQTMEVEDAS